MGCRHGHGVRICRHSRTGVRFFAAAAAAEEALFRGYAFQALVQGIGAWPAVLLSSAAFALAHMRNPSVDAVALANIFAAGIMLGWAYLRTRSLWFCTALHLGWNWAMSAVLEFPVSGLRRDVPLYDEVSIGPRWFTGGDFGPEGGVAATLAIVLLTALLLRARRLRESPTMRALRPLVDDRDPARWRRTRSGCVGERRARCRCCAPLVRCSSLSARWAGRPATVASGC